jgi:hypothetical protein
MSLNLTSPATHCFCSQQNVFANNWPIHRYREKHYIASVISVILSTVPDGEDGFYAVVIMSSLYCNFLFLF